MDVNLTELEQGFRESWRDFDPGRYNAYLDRTAPAQRLELLARLLSAELEFAFQPPPARQASSDDDDQRVKPCVQLFLLRFPDLSSKPDLVIRLIVLEFALRLRYDPVPPDPESYLSLCEHSQERLIRLLELTESKLPMARAEPVLAGDVGHSDSTVKETEVSASITLDPLPLNLGCFLLIRLLGKGGMGFVHAAIDLRSTAQVAVKVMRRVDAWSIYRFIEEFSWLSQLSHPNLVKLYDAFCDGPIRYFSMELVEGRTIREWFKRYSANDEQRWEELRRVLSQSASAIDYLHQHGVLHCDVKCSNVMITHNRRAVLLDLGLAIRAGQENRMVGTLQYMAPELLRGGSPTAASDWHSFGVLIYEVVTDSFPPVAVDLTQPEHERQYKLNREQLLANLGDCPEDLSQLCMDLLCRQPEDRPSGAMIVARLGGRTHSHYQFLLEPQCVGRDAYLQQLDEAIRLIHGQPGELVVIEGESGIGKSTLLQKWMDGLARHERLLLSVRCYRQDHTPLRLLNVLMQVTVAAVAELPPEMWQRSLTAQFKAISAVFPQVQQLWEAEPAPRPKDRLASIPEVPREAGIQALLEWLVELSHHRPIVLCVDDAHWADRESLLALGQLLTHPAGFRGSVIVADESEDRRVADMILPRIHYRPDESKPEDRCRVIALEPLDDATCQALLSQWAGVADVEMNESIACHMTQRSGGNPFLLLELFRTYQYHVHRGDASSTDWMLADSHSSVRRRFSLLPLQAENVLQYLAIADQSIGLHQLQMVSRILPHELQHTLSFLASQGWVRSRGEDLESDVEIAHENFRRVILQSIPRERLHRRHFRMARILSSETPPPWARIAAHYWLAEHFREAATCYLEAARASIHAAAVHDALSYLERAVHPHAERTPQEQLRVLQLKANCLAWIGSSQDSAKIYDQLASDVEDNQESLNLQCLAGEQWIRAGRLELGLARLKRALVSLGVVDWRKSAFDRLCLLCRVFRVSLSDPRRLLYQTNGIRPGFSEVEKCLNRLSPPLTFLDNHLGPELVLRMLSLAEEHGSDFDRALALMRSGVLLSFGGKRFRKRALTRIRMGRNLARSCRSEEALATGDFCMVIWKIQRGQILRALRYRRMALERYEGCPTSTQWEQQFVQWATLSCFWNSNQLTRLKESSSQLRQSARYRSDPMSLFWMHVHAAHWSDLVSDEAPRARAALGIASETIANQSFQSPRFFLWLSTVQQALYEGDARLAMTILRQDWQPLDRSLVMSTNHYRWHALVVRISCNLVALRDGLPHRSANLRDARRCVAELLAMDEAAFAACGHALELVVEAAAGKTAAPEVWQQAVLHLHQLHHHLWAYALQWQQSLYAAKTEQTRLQGEAEAALRKEGCRAPEKLFNIFLPLPHLSQP